MWIIRIGNRMFAAYKTWRKARREQLHQEFNQLVAMALAKSR